ncbi:unnamed protein product [Orchesella dallaii]|uniref:SAM domain-containing protein n=1 Tax=Orchesella dallaii TaxID=48710 RepID=A0ABP1REF7_9HEXA
MYSSRAIVEMIAICLFVNGAVFSNVAVAHFTLKQHKNSIYGDDSINTSPQSTFPLMSFDHECSKGEPWRSRVNAWEKQELQSISVLHQQLDDDKNGNIDYFESNGFLREELHYSEDNYERRQENMYRNDDNDDKQVSVKELWDAWVKSEVHNWTVDEVAEWISAIVDLPHYQEKIKELKLNGTFLPRIATNHRNFISAKLGIKDGITRQRLIVKAQDAVLFGSPKDNGYQTIIILKALLLLAITLCGWVFCCYKSCQQDLSRMSKDMEALILAEQTLRNLQKELEIVKRDQEIQVEENDATIFDEEVAELRDEIKLLREKLQQAEDDLCKEIKDRNVYIRTGLKLMNDNEALQNELERSEYEFKVKEWVPPSPLSHLLRVTYEKECESHCRKRRVVEEQLKQAKEAYSKLKKKGWRWSILRASLTSNTQFIDKVDKTILDAKVALTEITEELEEQLSRWRQIENLVKTPIVNSHVTVGITSSIAIQFSHRDK